MKNKIVMNVIVIAIILFGLLALWGAGDFAESYGDYVEPEVCEKARQDKSDLQQLLSQAMESPNLRPGIEQYGPIQFGLGYRFTAGQK